MSFSDRRMQKVGRPTSRQHLLMNFSSSLHRVSTYRGKVYKITMDKITMDRQSGCST